MTLKDKFDWYLSGGEDCPESIECEQIADDYAIDFAEWLYKWDNTRLPNGNWIIKLGLKPYTSAEVLEIFKKEKGL